MCNLPSRLQPCYTPLAAVAAMVLALMLGSTAAIARPPGGPKPSHNGATVTLSPIEVKPGGRIHLKGTRWPAGATVTIKLDDEEVGVIGVLKISRRGTFSGSVTVPANVLKVIKPGSSWLRLLAPASSINHQSDTSVKKPFTLIR